MTPRISPLPRSPSHDAIFSRILTPYSADAFAFFLDKHSLSDKYPFLVRNLRFGFPMGEFPPLKETVIFPNHPSARLHADYIKDYLIEEVKSQRMSGPFSREEMEKILKGPFQSSPIIVNSQPQPDGLPDKLRICRHLSKGDRLHPSTNHFVDNSKFPTRFASTAEISEIVSSLPYCLPHTH
jgi:hypothetical protein